MKYFGTDGIRGIVDIDLNRNLINKIAVGIVNFFKQNNFENKIVVGNDGRNSSDYIFSILAETLLKHGIDVYNIKLCSSPCLAFVTKQFNFPLGVMISASHNPKEYNGIKFFNSFGEKMCDDDEINFEKCMGKRISSPITYSKIFEAEKFKHKYVEYLKRLKSFDFKCIFDCANGGSSQICKQVFAGQQIINTNTDLNKINENCGATHPELLKSICMKKGVLGFAFDGDADRICVVTPNGDILDGDDLLFVFSKFFLNSGDNLVGSPYTNSALERQLKLLDIHLVRAKVGDKNIYKTMTELGSTLGGEESGHIIVKRFSSTGDGVLNAILLCNILALTKIDISAISTLKKDAQIKENVKLDFPLILTDEIKKKIEDFKAKEIRVVIRPSGTEPVVRIFAEGKTFDECKLAINEIKSLLK